MSEIDIRRNIVLIGPPYVGKSMIASELADSYNFELFDTDVLLRQHFGTDDLTEILQQNGWPVLRQAENHIIKYIIGQGKENVVIATGSGTVVHQYQDIRQSNMDLLRGYGLRVLILPHETPEVTAELIRERRRNLLEDETEIHKIPEFNTIYDSDEILMQCTYRWDFYEKAADLKIIMGPNINNSRKTAQLIIDTIDKLIS